MPQNPDGQDRSRAIGKDDVPRMVLGGQKRPSEITGGLGVVVGGVIVGAAGARRVGG